MKRRRRTPLDLLYQRKHSRVIVERSLKLPAGPDRRPVGTRIVLATDVHAREDWFPRSSVRDVVARINEVPGVDYVLLGGDFVGDDASAIDWSAEEFSRIAAPTFATLGNHDYWTDPERIDAALRGAGIEIMTNRSVPLAHGVHLAGIDSCWGGAPDAERALHGIPQGAPTVVLGHEPWLATLHDRFLHLAGHTHFGQARLPIPLVGDALAKMYMPRFSRPYPRRLYRRDDRSWVYTTSGVGYSTISFRLSTPPEIVVVDL